MTNANANAKAKIGDRIVIKGFAGYEPSADKYVGKTGVVESIDDTGKIFGTWGGLGLCLKMTTKFWQKVKLCTHLLIAWGKLCSFSQDSFKI